MGLMDDDYGAGEFRPLTFVRGKTIGKPDILEFLPLNLYEFPIEVHDQALGENLPYHPHGTVHHPGLVIVPRLDDFVVEEEFWIPARERRGDVNFPKLFLYDSLQRGI